MSGTLSQSSRLDRFATAFAAATGLSYEASRKWAQAEVGANNNLGIMSGGHPVVYATPEQGAAAAAALINRSPLYAGIRASIGHGTEAELDAIRRSPFHLGPTGLRAAGGIDPYYSRVFGLTPVTKPKSTVPAFNSATIDRASRYGQQLATTEWPSIVPRIELGPYVASGIGVSQSTLQLSGTPQPAAPATVAPAAPTYDPIGLAVLAGGAALALIILARLAAPAGEGST